MKRQISQALGFLTIGASLISAGCPSELTKVPRPANDHAPQITLSGYAVGTGNIDIPSTTTSRTLHVSHDTELKILGIATNAGGVKDFELAFTGFLPARKVSVTSTPDSNGDVPTALRILGTDNLGAVPGPILLTFKFANFTDDLQVVAKATNFNGNTTTITVHYVVDPEKPHVDSITTIPSDGRIPVGGTATVEWQTSCHATTYTVKVEGREGDNRLVLNMPNAPLNGSLRTTPRYDTNFTVTISNAAGSDSEHKWVTPRSNAAPPPATMYFFFKITSNSPISPCRTRAIPAPDEATAEAIVKSENVGDTVTQITEQEFVQSCG